MFSRLLADGHGWSSPVSSDVGHHGNAKDTIPARLVAGLELVGASPSPNRAEKFKESDLACGTADDRLGLSSCPGRPQGCSPGSSLKRTKDSGTVSACALPSTVSLTRLAASAHRLRTTYTVSLSPETANRFGLGLHGGRRHGRTGAGQLVAWRLADTVTPRAIRHLPAEWAWTHTQREAACLSRARSMRLGVPSWTESFASDLRAFAPYNRDRLAAPAGASSEGCR